ncbi:MAG: RNA polymerase sigma factor [Planctomycetota bacterium]
MSGTTPGVNVEDLLAHRPWVRSLAMRLVRDRSRADDLEQEVWLSAIRHPPRHRRSLRGWLSRLVRSRAHDARRSEERRARHETAAAEVGEKAPPGDSIGRFDAHRRLVAAVDRLDEPYRTTVVLRFFEGLSARDVAARMEVPVETARTRVRRALDRLREDLDHEHGGDRKAWIVALLPLTLDPPSVAAGAGTGAVGVGTAVKVTALSGVAAVVLWSVVASLPLGSAGGGGPRPPDEVELVAPTNRASGVDGAAVEEDSGAEDVTSPVAPDPGPTFLARVVDLADGSAVTDLRFLVDLREGGTVESRSDEVGNVEIPRSGVRAIRPVGEDWHIVTSPREIGETGEVRVYRTMAVTGRVREADGEPPLNPSSVRLELDLLMLGSTGDPRAGPQVPGGGIPHRRELPSPGVDGTFHVRVPRIRGAAILVGRGGWGSTGAFIPVDAPGGGPARMDFVLRRTPVVTGRLTRADGTPAPHRPIRVYVTRRLSPEEFREQVVIRPPMCALTVRSGAGDAVVTCQTRVTTEADGSFRLTVDVPGEVLLFVEPPPGHRPLLEDLGPVLRDRRAVLLAFEDFDERVKVRFRYEGRPLAGTALSLSILSGGEAQPTFGVTLDDEGRMPAGLLAPGWLSHVHWTGGADGVESRLLDWRGVEKEVELSECLQGTELSEARRRREARGADGKGD